MMLLLSILLSSFSVGIVYSAAAEAPINLDLFTLLEKEGDIKIRGNLTGCLYLFTVPEGVTLTTEITPDIFMNAMTSHEKTPSLLKLPA